MNTDKKFNGYNGGVRGPGEDMLSPKRPPHTKKRGPSPRLLRVLRAMIACLCCMVLVLSLAVCILPLFRIQSMESAGNAYYSAERLIEASGVRVGDEVFGVDLNEALNRVIDQCPYVESCTVEISSPVSLRITVREKSGVMYTDYGDGFVSFEYSKKTDSFYAIEVCKDDATLKPFLYVRLPSVTFAEAGKRLRFDSSSFEISYVMTLTEALENRGILSRVSALDVKDISMISYTLESGCEIRVGTMDDLGKKLDEAERQLALAENKNAVQINVSNPQKPTVR